MYLYPEDVKEIAVALRVSAGSLSSPDMAQRYLDRAEALDEIADAAIHRYGSKATVSIDVSAARGYALPMKRKQ